MAQVDEWLFCVEHYRNIETQHDAEDYMVDGFVLLRLPLPDDIDRSQLESDVKTLVRRLQDASLDGEVRKSFPKFHALKGRGGLWWIHLMRKSHKERLPQDFHTNSFTEEELLGTAPAEDESLLPREMWFDRDGDPIEGPPDRLMGMLYG